MRSDARANSSNAYANGADQNCGNFITDRTTSRVLKAPGGGSSISFGDEAPAGQLQQQAPTRRGPPASQISFGYDEAPAPARAAQPEQATYGMRSDARANSSNAYANGADQNCGNFITDRTTSRVLKAPGGGSSISFGDEAPAGQLQQQAPTRRGPPPASQISFGGEPTTYGMRSDARANSSNAYADGGNQNCGNFITDRPTSRVLKAPGGGSSICFGSENVNPQHTGHWTR